MYLVHTLCAADMLDLQQMHTISSKMRAVDASQCHYGKYDDGTLQKNKYS